MSRILFEVCTEGVDGVLAAAEAGAQRVELCASLFTGGLGPSPGVVAEACCVPGVEVMCMVRPRAGDFCFTDAELRGMLADIGAYKAAGAAGVVFGVLSPDGTVDEARTALLVERARPLSVTFHRAFDVTRDPYDALDALLRLGVDRVLTSGQRATAPEGAPLIAELVRRSAGRLTVLPGCGITPDNVGALVRSTGVREVHATAFAKTDSPMRHRNPEVYMGAPGLEESERQVTSAAEVGRMLAALP